MFIIAVAIIVVNLAGFMNMGYDKHQAKNHRWRTPEKRLFLYAIFGGAVGIFAGMKVWRHKTQHFAFRTGIPALIIVNAVGFYMIWKWIK